MNCPLETPGNAQVLLDYCSRQLTPASTEILERHIAGCSACREFAADQRAVWLAMDDWEAAPVSADFDSRLYSRIEAQSSWWELFVRPLRHVTIGRAIPAMALAVLLAATGFVLERPGISPLPPPVNAGDRAQVEQVQLEQVESALDTMDVLAEFSRQVRADTPEPKL
jgi:hypothetical protein